MAAAGEVHSEIHELYQQVVTDPDAFELVGDQLDLAPMVREVIVLDAPMSPLCRDDCQGLCPECGVDLNVETVRLRRGGGRLAVGCPRPAQGSARRLTARVDSEPRVRIAAGAR